MASGRVKAKKSNKNKISASAPIPAKASFSTPEKASHTTENAAETLNAPSVEISKAKPGTASYESSKVKQSISPRENIRGTSNLSPVGNITRRKSIPAAENSKRNQSIAAAESTESIRLTDKRNSVRTPKRSNKPPDTRRPSTSTHVPEGQAVTAVHRKAVSKSGCYSESLYEKQQGKTSDKSYAKIKSSNNVSSDKKVTDNNSNKDDSRKKVEISKQTTASPSIDQNTPHIRRDTAQLKTTLNNKKNIADYKDFSELHTPYREEPVKKIFPEKSSDVLTAYMDGSRKIDIPDDQKKRIPIQRKNQTETFTDLQSTIPVTESPKKTGPFDIRNDREKRRKKEERRIYIFAAAVIIVTVSIFFSLRFWIKEKSVNSEYTDLEKNYVTCDLNEDYEDYPRLDINFASLYALNNDIIGWLYVPDVNISLPIVKGTDNSFYTDHGFQKEDSEYGCLFIDSKGRSDFLSFVTPIYGKNIEDKYMSGSLKIYLSAERIEKNNSYFYIYLVNKTVRKYRLYSIFNETESFVLSSNYDSVSEKRSFIEAIDAGNLLSENSDEKASITDSFAVISAFENNIEDKNKFILAAVFEEAFSLSKK